MLQKIGERIAYYRKKCGLTQEGLAEQCSVTPQAVSKWENGITMPDISLLPRLAEIFGTTTDELLGASREVPVAVDTAAVDMSKAILRIHIADGGDTIDLRLPVGIVQVLLENGGIWEGKGDIYNALRGIDFQQVLALVSVGTLGKILEIHADDGGRVEIWVE